MCRYGLLVSLPFASLMLSAVASDDQLLAGYLTNSYSSRVERQWEVKFRVSEGPGSGFVSNPAAAPVVIERRRKATSPEDRTHPTNDRWASRFRAPELPHLTLIAIITLSSVCVPCRE
jgi:hypothetical protein